MPGCANLPWQLHLKMLNYKFIRVDCRISIAHHFATTSLTLRPFLYCCVFYVNGTQGMANIFKFPRIVNI